MRNSRVNPVLLLLAGIAGLAAGRRMLGRRGRGFRGVLSRVLSMMFLTMLFRNALQRYRG